MRTADGEPRVRCLVAEALLHAEVPVIAAVNGPAVGWGVELALLADVRVASEGAVFSEMCRTRTCRPRRWTWRGLHGWVARELVRLFATSDQEAVAAFLEKRAPTSTGR